MPHDPDPKIFETNPLPAMRRALAAMAAARAHARDGEVVRLLEEAEARVLRAYQVQSVLTPSSE